MSVKTARQPSVFFSDLAWAQLWAIVDYCKEEVGWYGLVDVEETGDYTITQLFVPEQEVSGVTTDIEPEAIGKLAAQLEAEGIDSSKLRYWGHSHVDMAVRPSGTDEDQIREYLDHVDWFIRGIHNKKRESKVDVYDVENNIIHQCCDSGLRMPTLTEEQKATLKAEIDANVQKKTFGYYHGGGVRQTPPYHRGVLRNEHANARHNASGPKSGGTSAERNQSAIEEAWNDAWGYGGYHSNFNEGADMDVSYAQSQRDEELEEAFIEFLEEDKTFFRACMYPFAFVAELLNEHHFSKQD